MGEIVLRCGDLLAALGAPRRGRRIAVALIDSGVMENHPLVGAVAEAVAITASGEAAPATGDALGHGTACAMVLRAYSPRVRIHSIRVFEETLAAPPRTLDRAMDYAIGRGVQLVNLSAQAIGAEGNWWDELCARAARRGIVVVRSAGGGDGPNVFTVGASEACRWGEFLLAKEPGVMACPYGVPLPGVSPEDDFHGASIATAHMTGLLAAMLERAPGREVADAGVDAQLDRLLSLMTTKGLETANGRDP